MAKHRRNRRPDEPTELLSDAISHTVNEDLDILKAQAAALDARVRHLEHRVEEADLVATDQTDVLDAHLRAARLAAELHLVTLELRAELGKLRADLGDEVDGARLEDLTTSLVEVAAGLGAATSAAADDARP